MFLMSRIIRIIRSLRSHRNIRNLWNLRPPKKQTLINNNKQ